MTTRLRIGFLPLVDAALLVVAREEGFAEQEGLNLDLVREASWANLRDRLSVRLLDAAQMLAPAAIAATLGLGHLSVPMAATTMLSLNGASITVSSTLFSEMAAAAKGDLADPKVAAAAFAKVAAERVAAGGAPPVLATVFSYSTHTLLIGAFLRLANLKAGADIPLVVLPPQYTAASLANGQIDGFCAGAPWNAVAVASGAGAIAAIGVDLMPDAPEKLLVMQGDELERRKETALALTRAIAAAAAWAEKVENRESLARRLARANYVDAPAAMIEADARWRDRNRRQPAAAPCRPIISVLIAPRWRPAPPSPIAHGRSDDRGGPARRLRARARCGTAGVPRRSVHRGAEPDAMTPPRRRHAQIMCDCTKLAASHSTLSAVTSHCEL